MEIKFVHSRSGKSVGTISNIHKQSTVLELKKRCCELNKKYYPERIELRPEPKGKAFGDLQTIESLKLQDGCQLYVKDLGPQIGWSTVFIAEYAGPLFLYLWTYQRPWLFYGNDASSMPFARIVHIACACWIVHYAKRIGETLFVHRFSHATMPLSNLLKNCSYYWLFTLYIGYHVNHPLFTAPPDSRAISALVAFIFCELGNLSIHLALRNLRPAGTRERRIPHPTNNPFTQLFKLVSCPHYTYEVGAWVSFTIMTQCLPAGLFALAGLYQMSVWALGKHRNYRKEFSKYPRARKAIIPFIL